VGQSQAAGTGVLDANEDGEGIAGFSKSS